MRLSICERNYASPPLITWITYHTSTTPLLSYVWLMGFGYGFARALVRVDAPYSNPEPSQTSTWLCPTVNGMYKSSTEVTGTYRKNAYNLSWLRASQSIDFKTGPHANS